VDRHRGDEAIAPPVDGLDTVLVPPTIAKGFADHHHALRQNALTHTALGPQVLQEFLFGDHAVAMCQEIGQDIQGVRLQGTQGIPVAEFVTFRIKRIRLKDVDHRNVPPWAHGCAVSHALSTGLTARAHATTGYPRLPMDRAGHDQHYHTGNLDEILTKS
jgi:hypothetical protein